MQDQPSSATATGCVIVAVLVVILFVCGGMALLLAGWLFFRAERSPPMPAAPNAPVPQVNAGHADMLSVDSEGSLYWNDLPIAKADLTRRLEEVKNEAGIGRSIRVRIDPAAPPGARDEVRQLLADRQVSFIEEK